MSQYQYVYFAAVDRALDDKQLAYMRRQSTRAEVTRWQFENEYHYGSFSGNTVEMMRRGYDVHLRYANYGLRELMFRLPQGLSISQKEFKAFRTEYGLEWKKDVRGKGGVLCIHPEADAGEYNEGYFEFDNLIACLPKIRDSLIAGDLRPLYLAWLACVWDEEQVEPPVPGGLRKLSDELKELADFYEISPDLVSAAAKNAPQLPQQGDQKKLTDKWLAECSLEELRSLLRRVLDGEGECVRAETLAAIRNEHGLAAWPTTHSGRTYEELQTLGAKAQDARHHREEKAQERARQKRLKTIAANPTRAVKEAEKLVQTRSTRNYDKAAAILAELRESLGSEHGPARANAAAKNIVRAHPTLNHLKKALREEGLSYK